MTIRGERFWNSVILQPTKQVSLLQIRHYKVRSGAFTAELNTFIVTYCSQFKKNKSLHPY
jgi:hypothetical protein